MAISLGWWIAAHPHVQTSIASSEQIRQLVDHDFKDYYSSHPAGDFAFQVWTNNAWIAALCITLGGFLGLPVIWLQFQNAVNVAVDGGLMAAHGKLGLFLGLILPHGLLELTAVWVAGGVGLRLGWTLIDPGPRRRAAGVRRGGPCGDRRGDGPGPRPVRVRPARGVRHAEPAADLGADRHRGLRLGRCSSPGSPSTAGGPYGWAHTGDLDPEFREDVLPVAG